MYALIITLVIIASVLLVLVVLAQNSKGGGLSSQFGGAGSQLIGVKKTGDLLERLTWGLIIGLVSLTLLSNFVIPREQSEIDTVDQVDLDRSAPSFQNVPSSTPVEPVGDDAGNGEQNEPADDVFPE